MNLAAWFRGRGTAMLVYVAVGADGTPRTFTAPHRADAEAWSAGPTIWETTIDGPEFGVRAIEVPAPSGAPTERPS
jgi:hypothetical protein